MFRCPECRTRKEFYIRKLGYKYIVNQSTDFCSKDAIVKTKTSLDFKKHQNSTMQCKACEHKDTVSSFANAYANPMLYFDAENLCDCGGEVWIDVEVEKPIIDESVAEFDGDQRSVHTRVRNVTRCEKCGKEAKKE